MAEIFQFKGYRYVKEKVVKWDNVITPPYDVISPEERQLYFRKSFFNMARVILPEGGGEKYANASRILREWVKDGVLKQDSKESFYILQQEFTVDKKVYRRFGMIVLVKLMDFSGGVVLPHEYTLPGPKKDRTMLLKETGANLGQVFGIYSDREGLIEGILKEQIKKRKPDISYTDSKDVIQKLWVINKDLVFKKIQDAMKPLQIYIADGHHRYESSLSMKDEYNKIMMTLVNIKDEGLLILPTHRLVKSPGRFGAEDLLNKLSRAFSIRKTKKSFLRNKVRKSKPHTFGLYMGGDSGYLLELIDSSTVNDGRHSASYNNLDVAVFHKIIISEIMGIDEEKITAGFYVKYIKESKVEVVKAMREVEAGMFDAFFLMRSASMDELEKVVVERERMPQKSTFFYPKVPTGMVINIFK